MPGGLTPLVGSGSSLAFRWRGYRPGVVLGFKMDVFGFMGGFREEAVTSENSRGKMGRGGVRRGT